MASAPSAGTDALSEDPEISQAHDRSGSDVILNIRYAEPFKSREHNKPSTRSRRMRWKVSKFEPGQKTYVRLDTH
jgi:hypothetical protein